MVTTKELLDALVYIEENFGLNVDPQQLHNLILLHISAQRERSQREALQNTKECRNA